MVQTGSGKNVLLGPLLESQMRQFHVRVPWKQPQSTKPSSEPLCALESFKLAPLGLLPLRENRFSTVNPNFGGLISQLI